jgi:hypothetical protein
VKALACAAMADWAGEPVGLHFIPPGEPWRNGYVESFNARVRDECLDINIFWSLAHARVVISDCSRHPPMNIGVGGSQADAGPLAPLAVTHPHIDRRRLAITIRAGCGIEAWVWMVDIAGVPRRTATTLMRESAQALLKAATSA